MGSGKACCILCMSDPMRPSKFQAAMMSRYWKATCALDAILDPSLSETKVTAGKGQLQQSPRGCKLFE